MRHLFLLALFILFSPHALVAAELVREGQARVAGVRDGDTLTLDNGVVVRLVGIQAPKLPLGRKGFMPWPLADEAHTALLEMTQGRTVQMGFGGARTDRHRRTLAHLYRQPDGLWVQGEMLRLGLARVYTFSDNRAMAVEMLALEREARAAERGIWAHDFYAVRHAENLAENLDGLEDSFQLVQGKVLKFVKISDYMFLNFGADYKTDFTVVIDRKDWPRFVATAPEGYTGRTVSVRGWIEQWNGPMLRISHPEQIEVLE